MNNVDIPYRVERRVKEVHQKCLVKQYRDLFGTGFA